MNSFKALTCGLAMGVAVAAFAMPVEQAEAKVIAYSSLQITNFTLDEGVGQIDLSTVSVGNTTTTRANLNGTNQTDGVGPVPGDSDAALSCVGACGGVGQNNYSAYHLANPAAHFSRGDASLTGSLLVPGGANGRTVAEAQLNSAANATGNGAIQSIATFTTIEFTMGETGDLALSFDVLGELRAFSDEIGGVAIADFDFEITLLDLTNGGTVPVGVSSPLGNDIDDLTALISAVGVEELNYLIDDTFSLTVSGLLSGNRYRLQISHNSDISATSSVSEPASMGLLGLGLLGLGALATRRRKAA